MSALLFCNIGWMSRCEGDVDKPDKIVGGGKFVREQGTGHEVCNFLVCRDGHVYGHVETIHGTKDRRIAIESIGGTGAFVDSVDVIWTATDPGEGGRRVVGWYRNATVFRERQKFARPPSPQHVRDGLLTYRIRALGSDVTLLDPKDRQLRLLRGPGWMGRSPWWVPSEGIFPEVRQFVYETRRLLDDWSGIGATRADGRKGSHKSASAAGDRYSRYVEAYEVQIHPRHRELQEDFERFLSGNGVTDLRSNVGGVDLRYRSAGRRLILVEVKPCERANARYAIRTAMGQLLDYRQRVNEETSLLIVLETKPEEEDRVLATSNGFGIAYPAEDEFEVVWPEANPA